MAALDWESWWKSPNLWAWAGHHRGEAQGRRRSGDEGYREYPKNQAEARVRGSRPRSCIEGAVGELEGWLQPPGRRNSTSPQSAGQFLSEKTVSVLDLAPNSAGAWRGTSRRPPSPCDTPQGDTEFLSARWQRRNTEPLGCWETARVKDLPSRQTARSCSMTPIKSDWLPSQKRAAVCSIPGRPTPTEEPRCWAALNPNTSSGFPQALPRKHGFRHTGEEMVGSHPRWRGPATAPGLAAVRTDQVWEGSPASAGSHFQLGLEGQLKERQGIWQGAPLRAGEAVLSDGYSLRGMASAPGHSAVVVPPAVGAANRPKSRSGFSSITIASRKVPLSTGTPGTSQPIMSGRSTPTGPPSDTPVDPSRPPVTRQRKATIIKVTGRRQSLPAGQPLAAMRPPAFRHSHAGWGDEQNDSSPWHGVWAGAPPEALVPPAHPTLFLSNPDVSQEGKPTVHRSTLSLYLKSPIGRGSALEGKEMEASVRPRRPLSFAGGLGLSGSDPYEAEMLHPRRGSLQLPAHGGTGRSLNTLASAAGLSCSAAACTSMQPHSSAEKALADARGLGFPGADHSGSRPEVEDAGSDRTTGEVLVPPHPELRDSRQKDLTLQEALQRFRPDFIRRSRIRQKELEQRVMERRAQRSPDPASTLGRGDARPSALRGNPRKPQQGAIGGEKVLHSCRRRPSETKKKGEEAEKKRVMTQTNRMRAEIFKKKLLDQILRRKSD
ncbi:(E2-independent) E3 ubiquitin-conjugating enzyme FATS isoform X2 [Brienomyrus brachyistius]|uniref:(E2-independent) E3 ubiquitin-conjugating enzyme FATS isoform X2 n=1 Tax=Brienomyrus brachyistius TaxID=42636 RepID=UPI0020B36577|nr:(E2-independent) E3 ubiquitin-conjugating enzyme FATS isoform X2 [Brienomyrus brachyistius]